MTPAAWARIRSDVVKQSGDLRLSSEVGRLSFHRLITDKQAATAFRIGEIYGAFERYKGKSRSTRSPSYEMGFGGDGITEELMTDEQLADLEDRIRSSEAAFLDLQEHLEIYPRTAVAALERLCVENCAINPTYLENMGRLLDNVAAKLSKASKEKRQRRMAATVAAISVAPAPVIPAAHRQLLEREAFDKFVRALRPDLKDLTLENVDKLQEAYDIFVAMKDRARFNASKKETTS